MQNLTPVGLSRDGQRLILISSAGDEYAVAVDTRLRAAMRGENARLSQLEMKMESALRPRDIQARIRAGESAEEVAAAAQTTVEAIMAFATPVLAERAHVATNAQRASVRRRSGESSSAGRTLGDAAALFFADHSLHDEDVDWDAWRRPDGRWALVARYAVGGRDRTAEFTHDLPGRYVVAENDEARILTGELREPEERAPAGGARASQARRLSAVPSQDELPLGDDAIELVREPRPDPITAEQRAPGPGEDSETVDEGLGQAVTDTDEDIRDAGLTDAAGAAESFADPTTGPTAAETATTAEPATATDAAPDGDIAGEPVPPKKKSRSSVPSWDEIMFGGKSE